MNEILSDLDVNNDTESYYHSDLNNDSDDNGAPSWVYNLNLQKENSFIADEKESAATKVYETLSILRDTYVFYAPTLKSPHLDKINKGDKVFIHNKVRDFYLIEFNDIKGYIKVEDGELVG